MNNKPSLHAYTVRERGKNQKAIWTRIGVAWAHEKGNGYSLELEAVPVNFDGRLVLMPPRNEKEPLAAGHAEPRED